MTHITASFGGNEYVFAICLFDGEGPIGEASLFRLDRANGSAELGILIGEVDEWSKGHGTDAVNCSASPSCGGSGSR